ncbi:MAG: hypothetical protein IJM21_03895 [Clostridia bacterium]|nr:hypothetical protein [Clostridia bacterium]
MHRIKRPLSFLLAVLFFLPLCLPSCQKDAAPASWTSDPGPTDDYPEPDTSGNAELISSFDDVTVGGVYEAKGDLVIDEEYEGCTLNFQGTTVRGTGVLIIRASAVAVESLALDGISILIEDGAALVSLHSINVIGSVEDHASSLFVNCSIQGDLRLSSSSILENSYVAGTVSAASCRDILIAKSVLDGSVSFTDVSNSVLLLNRFSSRVSLAECRYFTVAENRFADMETPVEANGSEKLLLTGNSGYEASLVSGEGCTAYGSDVPGSAENGAGADFSLLPSVENDRFAGYIASDGIRVGNGTRRLADYIAENAVDGATLILPPGAYSVSSFGQAHIVFDRLRDFRLFGYGVLLIFEDTGVCGFYLNGCTNLRIAGLTTDYRETPYAQGTVTETAIDHFIWKPDAGYTSDIANPDRFDPEGAAEAFKPGMDYPYADLTLYSREEQEDGTFRVTKADLSRVAKGDKVIFRMKGSHVNILYACRDVVYEDVTIYSGAMFGVMDALSEGGTVLNRLKITPGPVPEGGTEERLISTCDATHITGARQGPVITNCWFEKMTDDGTNIHGRYARVVSYSPTDKYLSYTGYDGGDLQVPIRKGDLLRIVTASGTLVASGKASQNGEAGKCKVSLDFLPDLDTRVLSETLLIENLSASSGGFVFRNNYVAKIRSRGILIKAPGTVEHNTVEACGMAAILISPEIEGNWGESGFVSGLTVRENLLSGTGLFFTANQLSLYSPITITGGASRNGDAESLPAADILIEGNRVTGRISSLALSAAGVRGLTVRGNSFGPRAASDPFTGRVLNELAASGDDDRTPVRISDCSGAVLEDNTVCPSVVLPAQILQPLD